MNEIRFVARVAPRAKERAQSGRTSTGQTVVFSRPKTRRWEAAFAAIAERYAPDYVIDEPVELEVLTVLPRPKSLFRRADPDGLLWAPGRVGDTDNFAKAVMDALKSWWTDDCRVVSLRSRKAYAERDGVPRVEVVVRSAPPLESR